MGTSTWDLIDLVVRERLERASVRSPGDREMKKVLGMALVAVAIATVIGVAGVGANDCTGPGTKVPGPVSSPVVVNGGAAPMAADPCAVGVTYVDQVMTGY